MKKVIDSYVSGESLVWRLNEVEFMKIKDKKWLSLSWVGLKLTDNEKVSILKEQLVFKNEDKIAYLLRKTSLNKIKLEMEKRFRTSYTDIMIKIVTMNSKLNLEPLYGTYEDYDSYNEKLGYCIDKVLKSHENKYGRFE